MLFKLIWLKLHKWKLPAKMRRRHRDSSTTGYERPRYTGYADEGGELALSGYSGASTSSLWGYASF